MTSAAIAVLGGSYIMASTARGKDDHYNAAIAGATVGFLVSLPRKHFAKTVTSTLAWGAIGFISSYAGSQLYSGVI